MRETPAVSYPRIKKETEIKTTTIRLVARYIDKQKKLWRKGKSKWFNDQDKVFDAPPSNLTKVAYDTTKQKIYDADLASKGILKEILIK